MNKNYSEGSAARTRACMRTTIATAAVMVFGMTAAFAQPLYPSWNGFHIGGNSGIGASQVIATAPPFAGSADFASSGLAAGVELGVNWHVAPQWVLGIEADIGHLGISRAYRNWNDPLLLGVTTDGYATVRARYGFTTGPSLFFFTAGTAYVGVNSRFDEVMNGVSASSRGIANGWVAGAGIETVLDGNWYAKAEYLYIDAGNRFLFNEEGIDSVGLNARFDHRFHVFRCGINYRFGDGNKQPASTVHDWRGFYAGIHAGVSLSQTRADHAATSEFADLSGAGIIGGIQAGYNFVLAANLIAGVEADIGHLGINHSPLNWNDSFELGVRADWYATVRGRVAYNTGPALLFVTGGVAFVDLENKADLLVPAFTPRANTSTAAGWVIGAGIEAALGKGWSAKTEYLFIDVGHLNVASALPGNLLVRFENGFHLFRFGLNRKFGS